MTNSSLFVIRGSDTALTFLPKDRPFPLYYHIFRCKSTVFFVPKNKKRRKIAVFPAARTVSEAEDERQYGKRKPREGEHRADYSEYPAQILFS